MGGTPLPLPLGEISLPLTEKCLSLAGFCPSCLVYIGTLKDSVVLKHFFSSARIPLYHSVCLQQCGVKWRSDGFAH